MKNQKINKIFGVSYSKAQKTKIFSESEIKAFKSMADLFLAITAAAGVITLAAAAPNLVGALGKLSTGKIKGNRLTKDEKREKAVKSVYYLKRSGLIKIRRTPEEVFLSLTQKGRKRLKKISFNILRIYKQRKWNKKWWLVAADIPTKDYKIAADLFRKKLKEMGFWPLQRTLWLYPFDPRDEMQVVAEHFGIARYVTLMEVSRLDRQDEQGLKKYFKSIRIL